MKCICCKKEKEITAFPKKSKICYVCTKKKNKYNYRKKSGGRLDRRNPYKRKTV